MLKGETTETKLGTWDMGHPESLKDVPGLGDLSSPSQRDAKLLEQVRRGDLLRFCF